MHECTQAELSQFARWAKAMSDQSQRMPQTDGGNPEEIEGNVLSPSHPFLEELCRYREKQIHEYLKSRHYLKIRLKMQRASRRTSLRRGHSVSPLYQTGRFETWCGWEEAWAITNSSKPDPAWKKTPPIVGEMAGRLLADLVAIDRELDFEALEPAQVNEDGGLEWQIHIMDYTDCYDLGLFKVCLRPDGLVSVSGGVYAYDGYCHPHVSRDGRLCTGRFGAMSQWLYQDGALELVFTTINHILRTYNPESPYVRLEDLVSDEELDECNRCGTRVHSDESTVIGCESYCSECILWCDGCEEYVSLDCEGEYFRDQWYCANCAEALLICCDQCGGSVLKGESITGGDGYTYCPACVAECADCQRAWPKVELVTITPAGEPERRVCLDCAEEFAQGRDPETAPDQELLEQPA